MHFLLEMPCEIFKIWKSSARNAVGNGVGNSVGNAVGNAAGNSAGNSAGNLVGNHWENDAVFSLNTLLRTIYCLQTIHEPACVIFTLFQFLNMLNGSKFPIACDFSSLPSLVSLGQIFK